MLRGYECGCSWNTNGIMVWAWMLRGPVCSWNMNGLWFEHGCCGAPYALGTRTEVWFWRACSGDRMLLQHQRNYGLGMDALGTRTELWFVHGCCRAPYALGTRTELWFGHGCSGDRMLLEHERNYGLGISILGQTWGRRAEPFK